MSERRKPGLLALAGLTTGFTALFVGALTWGKLGRDRTAIDLRTRERLAAR